MRDWPVGKRTDWKAWIELTHRMKGQRAHERKERRWTGRGRRYWQLVRRVGLYLQKPAPVFTTDDFAAQESDAVEAGNPKSLSSELLPASGESDSAD